MGGSRELRIRNQSGEIKRGFAVGRAFFQLKVERRKLKTKSSFQFSTFNAQRSTL
jgi:hypothetical protein